MAVLSDPGLGARASSILLVLGQMPFPIELLDAQGRVLYCNTAYGRTFLEPDVPVLDQVSRVFPDPLADGQTRASVLAQAAEEGLWKGNLRVKSVLGETLPVRVFVFPVRHPQGDRSEFAVYYEDIRQEVEAREALDRQQSLLAIHARQSQMGELLNIIAHQWRQPLTVILSLIGNLQIKTELGTLEPAYLAGKLEKVTQTVQLLSETIDLFRNFYAPGKTQIREDLGCLLGRALELLSPTLKPLGVTVDYLPPAEALSARVFPGEFLQVALELISNARDAMATLSEGSPRILRISLFREGLDAVLKVGNNGAGLSPETLFRLSEPNFFGVAGTGGIGLGLHMVKTIVETHHAGSLRASSSEGWTDLICTLPLEGTP